MDKKQDIIKDASIYTTSTYIARIASFVTGFVTKRLLGPENVGIWNLINILLGYMPISQVGTMEATVKEIPYWRVKNDLRKVNNFRNIAFTVSLIAAILMSCILIIYIYIKRDVLSIKILAGFIMLALIFPVWQVSNCQIVMFRASKKFFLLGKTLIFTAFFNLSVMLFLVWKFGIYGRYWAFCILTIVIALYWYFFIKEENPFRFKLYFNWKEWRFLCKTGIPLAIGGLLTNFFMTIDSIIVAKYIGVTALGYYSIALSLKQEIFMIPNAFSVIMFPRFQERYSQSDDMNSLRNYLFYPIIAFSFFLLPITIGSAYTIMPTIITYILPRFVPGINAMKLVLTGVFFLSLAYMPGQFLITVNKQIQGLWLSFLTLSISTLIIYFVAVKLEYGIDGIAIATAVGYLIRFMAGLWFALSFILSFREIFQFFLKIFSSFIYTFAILLILDKYIIKIYSNFMGDLFIAFIKLILFLIFISPLIWYANKETEIIKRFKILVIERVKRT